MENYRFFYAIRSDVFIQQVFQLSTGERTSFNLFLSCQAEPIHLNFIRKKKIIIVLNSFIQQHWCTFKMVTIKMKL